MLARLIGWVAATTAVLHIVAAASPVAAMPEPPTVAARAALVMDAANGHVLWERNGEMALPPASTTKVMTTILALESGQMKEDIEVSAYAASQPPSKLGLRPGQQVRLRDLTYALMLKSANDAAVAVAEGLAGSVRAFARRMNLKARQIGARNTYFTNPSGLPDDDHRTSAHDLALMLRYAMTVPGFRTIAGTRSTFVPVEGKSVRMVPVTTHNRLLDNYVVQVFGKTGYTRAAGKCFVGAAEIDGRAVMVAVLGSTNVWGDTRKLIEYGLNLVAPQSVAGLDFGTGAGGGTWSDRDDRDDLDVPPPPPPGGTRWARGVAAPDPERLERAWAGTGRRVVDPEEQRRRDEAEAERAALAAERASMREARAERAAIERAERRAKLAVAQEQQRLALQARREAEREARTTRLTKEADARADRKARMNVERLVQAEQAEAARRGRSAKSAKENAHMAAAVREAITAREARDGRGRSGRTATRETATVATTPRNAGRGGAASTASARGVDSHATARGRKPAPDTARTNPATLRGRTVGTAERAQTTRSAKADPTRATVTRGAATRRPVAQGDSEEAAEPGARAKRPAATPAKPAHATKASAKAPAHGAKAARR